MTDPARIDRRWRLAFVAYALVLTTLTHWPRLSLPVNSPVGDKTVHLVAFGLFAWLLARTGWLRPRVLAIAVTLLWCAIDEYAQGIPGLNRTVSGADLAANVLGVLTAGVWLWAVPARDAALPGWPDARALRRAGLVTLGVALAAGALVIILALVHARAVDAQLPAGLQPRLELLTALLPGRFGMALVVAAGVLLAAVFTGTAVRSRRAPIGYRP